MFRRTSSLLPAVRAQIRHHSTENLKPIFPKIEEITADDIGSSSNLETRYRKHTYHLERSSYGNLPIYIEYKDNSNVHTEIRKISGDITLLRNDLSEILDYVPKKNFKILNESRKILIKGNHKNELVKLFEAVF